MPEENFEQQARRKAEEFGMEPKPDVWLRVEAAIAPQRRKRRVLLWWWLLPLCLGGFALAVLIGNNKQPFAGAKSKVVVVADKEEASRTKASQDTGKIETEQGKEGLSSEKIKERLAKNEWEKDKIKRKNTAELLMKKENPAEQPLTTSDYFESKNSEQVVTTNQDIPAGKITIAGKPGDMPAKEAMSGNLIASHQNDSGKQSTAVTVDSINKDNVASSVSSVPGRKDAVASNKPGNTQIAIKGKNKKWQVGIMSEIGVASWAKGLLEDGNKSAPNNDALGTLPNGNNATRDSLLASGALLRQTNNGLDAAIGIAVRKELSKRFYVNLQLGYRYQGYQVAHFVRVATSQSNMNLTSYLISSDYYHTHFFNLATGIGIGLLTGKRNFLSAEINIDNSFLFAIKQQDKTQSSVFTGRQTGVSDFSRWQPQVMVSLPFGWQRAGKVRLQIAPFVRSGLKPFEKSSDSYKNNHLMSAGIQAVYFFK